MLLRSLTQVASRAAVTPKRLAPSFSSPTGWEAKAIFFSGAPVLSPPLRGDFGRPRPEYLIWDHPRIRCYHRREVDVCALKRDYREEREEHEGS
jgi:hypothetical protein